ncbi:hypothetical protein G6L37_04405 [Agrobacterium rubi]|nr:hypothetical protein [Agrobacterium rubi]NTF24594.1 hypothetical protein [Agrobacterium rubi]
MNLSEVETPKIGLKVKSYWRTPGKVSSIREMRGQDFNRWPVHDRGQLVIGIEWSGGEYDEAPQSHMEWVSVVN